MKFPDNIPDLELSNQMNTVNRFNVYFFSRVFTNAVHGKYPELNPVHVDLGMVQKLFQRVKERKSPGPDGIGGRIFKNCAAELSYIFSYIFNRSLQLHKVPSLWKASIVVSVPKNKSLQSLNEYRPIALT